MATVVDSLVVELGLDPTNLSKGSAEALRSLRAMEENAKKQADLVEDSSKRSVNSLATVQRTLLGVGALIGANSMRKFTADIVTSDAALGRLAYQVKDTAKNLSTWEQAVRLAGGTQDGFRGTVSKLSNELHAFAITGQSEIIAYFRSLGVAVEDEKGNMRGMTDILVDVNRAIEKFGDPAKAGAVMRMLGLDEGTINLLIRGESYMKKLIAESMRLGSVSQQNTEQAQALEQSFTKLNIAAANFGRYVSELVGPDALKALKQDLEDIERIVRALASVPSFFRRLFGDEGQKKDPGAKWYDVGAGWNQFKKMFSSHDWTAGRTEQEAAREKEIAKLGSTTAGRGSGAFSSQSEKEAFIRREAAMRGIDPDIAMQVAKSEGFYNFNSAIPGEKSYGAFQLNISKNPSKPSLGDRFVKDTGLNPADPSTEREGIRYSLDEVRKVGWGQWYGWKGDKWAGISRGGDEMSSRGSGGSTTNSTTIGTITINTDKKTAEGISGDLRDSLRRSNLAGQAQTGPN